MFYRGMILPRVTGNYNPQTELLENVYKRSMKVLKETIDSAHSKTLDELYTDTFKPSHTKSDVTTVKSLKTGEPVEINLKYRLDGLNLQEQENRFKYSAYLSNSNKYLGSKTFGIKQKEGKNVFEGGFIVSAKNNKYSGVQIRLLQAACEEADKNGIQKMPLCSYLPAVKFHTMMGFRPTEQCNGEVRSLSDIAKETENFCRDYSKEIYEEDVTPILTKIGNTYHFDRNRTLYCATMKRNERLLEYGKKRNLSLKNNFTDSSIDMELSGKEFEKWIERSKGFEIISDKAQNPEKRNFKEIITDFIHLNLYGG